MKVLGKENADLIHTTVSTRYDAIAMAFFSRLRHRGYMDDVEAQGLHSSLRRVTLSCDEGNHRTWGSLTNPLVYSFGVRMTALDG